MDHFLASPAGEKARKSAGLAVENWRPQVFNLIELGQSPLFTGLKGANVITLSGPPVAPFI